MGTLEGILELATEETYHHGYRRRDKSVEFEREMLSFRLAKESYAVDISVLREILRWRPVTPVPRTPDFIPGVLSVRGEIVPVLDLGLRLGLQAAQNSRTARVLLVQKKQEVFGLVVEAVSQVVRLRATELESAPETLRGVEEFVVGIGRPGGEGMLLLLNLPAILNFSVG